MGVSRNLRWSIYRYLTHLLDSLLHFQTLDGPATRIAMQATGALIGGRTALAMLVRCSHDKIRSDIEFFVSARYARTFECALRCQGFAPLSYVTPQSENKSFTCVHTFGRMALTQQTIKMVKVIHTSPHVVSTFAQGFTTAHMTYIGAKSLYTAYPRLTLSGRAIMPARERLPNIQVTRDLRGPHRSEAEWLLDLGFDLRWYGSWADNGACGRYCSVVQRAFHSPDGLRVRFNDPDGWSEEAETRAGPNVRFSLLNECPNSHCPNHRQRR